MCGRATLDLGFRVAAVAQSRPLAQRAQASHTGHIARGILPAVLIQGGLRAAVTALVSTMPIPVTIDIAAERFAAAVEATAYFIVAEALTNTAKHAQAQGAEVTARASSGTLQVRIRDDGVGGARPGGSGLVGLRDRVEALGGALTIDSPHGRGTTLLANLPLDDTAARPPSPDPA